MDILNIKSNLYSGQNTYEEKFSKLADSLLNEISLVINGIEHRIVEVEMYLYNEDHPDNYTHCDNDQKNIGNWYFHKQNGGSYKAGTYKGLDITFGTDDEKICYGGILIRAIEDNDRKLIIGPCKVVDHILNICKCATINELVNGKIMNVNDELSKLYIKSKKQEPNKTIYSGPRVGLSFKTPIYAVKNYRFLTNISTVEKYKPSIVVKMFNDGIKKEKICQIANIKSAILDKYLKLYNNSKGKSINKLKPSPTNIVMLMGS